jgi:hypothetical protein
MSGNLDGVFTFTHPVFLDFPALLEPKAFPGATGQDTEKLKYSANLRFKADHPDYAALKTMMAQVAKADWPVRPLSELKFPHESGDKAADKRKSENANIAALIAAGKTVDSRGKALKVKPDGEFQRGFILLAARSKFQPQMAILRGNAKVDLEGDAIKANISQFYFGVEVLAQIKLQAYRGIGQNPDGVCAYLNMVLSLNRGPKIGGGSRASASDVFKGYAGSVSTENPLGDDEIPF